LPIDAEGNLIERRIGEHSNLSKNDSDRKLMIIGGDYSIGSSSGDELSSNKSGNEFRMRRKSRRNKQLSG